MFSSRGQQIRREAFNRLLGRTNRLMRLSDGERAETPPPRGLPHDAGPGESGEQPQCGLGGYAEVPGQTFGGDGRLPQHEVEGVRQPAALVDPLGQHGAGCGSAV
jgi:hypothetical protein